MQWDLAGYGDHPIDGEASQIEACSSHLGTVAGDIREQIFRLQAIDSGEVWQSAHGAQESFQETVEDLPEKLELVATRYEKTNQALETFHPVLASTKQDAEYNIQQAAQAQAEVERAEAGIQAMQEFEEQAQRDADARNDDLEPGEPEVEPDQWVGEDYHSTLATAQSELDGHIRAVQDAVAAFESAAETCAEAIKDAANDNLKNDSGWFSWVPSWDDILDFVEVVVEVLKVIGMILAVVALFVPGLNFIAFLVTAAIFAGTLLLALNDRASWWEVAGAGLATVTAGLGNYVRLGKAFMDGANTTTRIGSMAARLGTEGLGKLDKIKTGIELTNNFVDWSSNGPKLDVVGGLTGLMVHDMDSLMGGGKWIDVNSFHSIDMGDLVKGFDSAFKLGEMGGEALANLARPGGDQTGLGSVEGLGAVEVPAINLDISVQVPEISVSVNTPTIAIAA